MLSVQVHPPDGKADLIPKGETGKTEAWVVLEAEPGSHVYAGLKPGTTTERFACTLEADREQLFSQFHASARAGHFY